MRLLRFGGSVLLVVAVLLATVDYPARWLYLGVLPWWLRALVLLTLLVALWPVWREAWLARREGRRAAAARAARLEAEGWLATPSAPGGRGDDEAPLAR
jgi:hypothetical protein